MFIYVYLCDMNMKWNSVNEYDCSDLNIITCKAIWIRYICNKTEVTKWCFIFIVLLYCLFGVLFIVL